MVDSIRGGGVSQIHQQVTFEQNQQVEHVGAKRIEAFDNTDRMSISNNPGLTSGVKNMLAPEQQEGVSKLMSGLSTEAQTELLQAGKDLANGLLGTAQGSQNSETALIALCQTSLGKTQNVTGTSDAAALANESMLTAYAGVNDDLAAIANKVAGTNDAKKTVREEMSVLQDEIANWPEGVKYQEITYKEVVQNPDGTFTVTEKTVTISKEDAQSLHGKMDTQLTNLSEMSQMDMLNLQDVMNKQSQLMQMMSNISKIMNDIAMTLIRNLK